MGNDLIQRAILDGLEDETVLDVVMEVQHRAMNGGRDPVNANAGAQG